MAADQLVSFQLFFSSYPAHLLDRDSEVTVSSAAQPFCESRNS
jgi:hypothetical protein